MPRLSRLTLLLAASLAATSAFAGEKEDQRARDAVRVLTDIQAIPESAIPDKLLDEARAIVIVPDTIKAGLVIGGRRGHGLLSVKNPDGTWSNPSFISLTGGSIGFQAGVQSADVVLVFRGERGVESIVNGKFTLGADAGVAAGPLGRSASTATDGELKAEIWSWSRARGLFAGVALDGAVLAIDDVANQSVYGEGTTPRMIFENRIATPPSNAVVAFRDELEEATAAARANRADAPVAAPVAAPAPAPAAPAAPAPQATSMPATSTPAASPPAPAPAESQGFQPVQDTPAKTEPLPAAP